jgi:UDP-glucuronate 4-epimerase
MSAVEPLAGRRVLVTGAAGFIGMHVARALAEAGVEVTGVDDFDPYYDVALKAARIEALRPLDNFAFARVDLADAGACAALFTERFDRVVHLAAQPGVRYSLVDPQAYVRNNLVAFGHVLEGCRHNGVAHLVYASSSSVYGASHTLPFSEDQRVDHPVSLYAATKKANELMAHSYSHLYRLPTTGLRFFTVYGPWGRPDQAPMIFTKAILEGRPIDVYNGGRMQRDFTYVDDIVEGIVRVIDRPPKPDPGWDAADPDPATSSAPWRIFNIGNHQRVELMTYIRALEEALGKKAKLDLLPMQPGDVRATEADTAALEQATGFRPSTPVEDGIRRFVAWYRDYYKA